MLQENPSDQKLWKQRYGITLKTGNRGNCVTGKSLATALKNISQKGNHGNYVTETSVRTETMATTLQNSSQTENHGYCVVSGTFSKLETMETMRTALQNNPQAGKCNNLRSGHYRQQCQN